MWTRKNKWRKWGKKKRRLVEIKGISSLNLSEDRTRHQGAGNDDKKP